MKIITIGREFGSGGRELGKRLAENLGFAYYDEEILTAIAQKSGLAEEYVKSVVENVVPKAYPITYGRTFCYTSAYSENHIKIFKAQEEVMRELAGTRDCVIVGRCADIILQDLKPLNLFVFADMDSDMSTQDKLKEFVGHTPLQVLVGALLGISIAIPVCLML